mgnify:CR=1 FL=1
MTMTAHGYSVGDYVYITGATTPGYNGSFVIDSTSTADTFHITLESDLIVEADSGTTDGTTTNKLVDSSQNFLTTILPGMVVVNTTDSTTTTVSIVDSNNDSVGWNDCIKYN